MRSYIGTYLLPWAVLVVISATVVFTIKNKVHLSLKNLNAIQAAILAEREAIHVLQAERSYLGNPKRIKVLAKQGLHMKELSKAQVLKSKDLSLYLGVSEK